MKNLKIRLGLFSLLTILAASVFLTSCEQDAILTQVEETTDVQQVEFQSSVQEYIKKQDEVTFNLPPSMEGADENTLQNYLVNMTISQIAEREMDYKIEHFLGSLGRLDEVQEEFGDIDLLTLNDLKKYASEQELAEFNSFEVASVLESRGCWTISSICIGFFRMKTRFCCSWRGCSTRVYWSWGC